MVVRMNWHDFERFEPSTPRSSIRANWRMGEVGFFLIARTV